MKEILKHYESPFVASGYEVYDANNNMVLDVFPEFTTIPPEASIGTIAQEIAAALNKAAKFDNIKKHRDILAMHLAEIKAIDDGESHNTIKATIDHCIAEVDELDPCGKNKAAEVEDE